MCIDLFEGAGSELAYVASWNMLPGPVDHIHW